MGVGKHQELHSLVYTGSQDVKCYACLTPPPEMRVTRQPPGKVLVGRASALRGWKDMDLFKPAGGYKGKVG